MQPPTPPQTKRTMTYREMVIGFVIILVMSGIFSYSATSIFMKYRVNKEASSVYGIYYGDVCGIGINVKDHSSVRAVTFTLNHEVGHYIWYHCITEQQRREWEYIYDKMNQTFVDKDTAVEEFAEDYAYYSMNYKKSIAEESNIFLRSIEKEFLECS